MADNIPEFTKDNSLPLEVVDEEKGIVEGYASVYGVKDSQEQVVDRGAFDHILNDPKAIKKIKFLWQHDYAKPIGKIQKLWDDGIGLKYQAKYNQKTSWGKDAYGASLNEDIDGNSIGYSMRNGKAVKDDEGTEHLQTIGLMEISNVTFPSNAEATHTGVKSANDEKAGRVQANRNESRLKQMRGLIDEMLSELGGADAAASDTEAVEETKDESKEDEMILKQLQNLIDIFKKG
jgi:HK97 family phage prohead protease